MPVSKASTLAVFLQKAKAGLATAISRKSPIVLVIGNQSADLDSFTSSITYAYFRSLERNQDVVPILNIPKDDLSIRPEFHEVMRHANIDPASLITLDDLGPAERYPETLPPNCTCWILTDHNKLEGCLGQIYSQQVVGVIDHHEDEKAVAHHTNGEPRVIQNCGSCTTLVVDLIGPTWDQLRSGPLPDLDTSDSARIAKFALSSILVDTKNLENPDKTTSKDIVAARYLRRKIEEANNDAAWDPNAFFVALKEAKNNIKSVPIQGVFRKDYKEWEENGVKLGTSSAVKRLHKLVRKASKEQGKGADVWATAAKKFMDSRGIDLWLVLTSYNDDDGVHKRELALHWEKAELKEIVDRFETRHGADLQLERSHIENLSSNEAPQGRRTWIQHNSAMSRKQVAPILRKVIRGD